MLMAEKVPAFPMLRVLLVAVRIGSMKSEAIMEAAMTRMRSGADVRTIMATKASYPFYLSFGTFNISFL